jgi:phosphoenolpyruvate carboxykinase (ATP)
MFLSQTHTMNNQLNNQILENASTVSRNLSSEELYELSHKNGEGQLSKHGALVVETGKHTGRSANDKFFVKEDDNKDKIHWGDTNMPISEENYQKIANSFLEFAKGKSIYAHDLMGGADRNHSLKVTIITEYAWHGLFARHLLVRPTSEEVNSFIADFTIINFPSLKMDPNYHGTNSETAIIVNLKEKVILISGTEYAGETKKSVFTLLNFLLPEKQVMPMHCSVNTGNDGSSAIFFGLSGTGKTTLSADPNRSLLGDDEHGWSDEGLFNFEGGCYAKLIRLSQEAEPEIYATTQKKLTVIENAVLKTDGDLDLDDNSLTENTRGAYPLEFIPNVTLNGKTSHPKNIIMLTADAFGVLPPISKLSPSQAMYHFLSGYTAKVAGTEIGLSNEPQATFSTCFGAPFMPRNPIEYGDLLKKKISEHEVDCWLVNTGWIGGVYGVGKRISIKDTRILLNAALSGELANIEMRKDENFGFEVPLNVNKVNSLILNPKNSWSDPIAYDLQAKKLVSMFIENFTKFEDDVDDNVRSSGPVA